MAPLNLANMQGDLYSRGFPKYNETYYFFSIVSAKEFSKALAVLAKSGHISSLQKVQEDWCKINKSEKEVIIPVANALIAFTKTGLDKIQSELHDAKLSLDNLQNSDPAFFKGMAKDIPKGKPKDGPNELNDPPVAEWDPLFNTDPIHGLLKVAGNSQEIVDSKLGEIKSILGHPSIIADIAGQSLPTSTNSRLDGHIRPKEQGLKGHEHFGFRDGVSQPLLKGIDSEEAFERGKSMETEQNIIIVTAKPPEVQQGVKAEPKKRPEWMVEGSFLVFRKLEQDVQAFRDLIDKFASGNSVNAEHFGAKLMGRWKSGAPVVLFPNEDTSEPHAIPNNDFKYENNGSVCPLAAHIRKCNPRNGFETTVKARMVRSGIAYGTEFDEDKNDKRGLLFACYQSSIENGFKFVQKSWCNDPKFPPSMTDAGYDPFIGQPPKGKKMFTTMDDAPDKDLDPEDKDLNPVMKDWPTLVTMRGGEYFFVPSISALVSPLGSA